MDNLLHPKDDKELREEIARELHFHDWDCEVSMAYNYGTSGYYDEQDDYLKEFYLKQADQILSLSRLDQYVLLADDQTLPLNNPYSEPRANKAWREAVKWMADNGFRKVQLKEE